jgi:peptide/nickel transport system substrate-binding protein
MAYPDKVVATFGVTGNVIDSRLIADAPADQTAMSGETIQAQNIGRAMSDPRIKNRVISGNDNSAWYVAINNKKVPNLKVRQAIQALVNKETYRGTLGGEAVGDYANGVIPPAIEGYEDFKVPDVPPQGDPALAEKLLKESGETLPITMKYDFGNTEQNAKAAAALQQALQRSPNIKVTLNPIARDVYYSTIGKTAAQSELSLAGWGPDWPDASTVIPPILDGRNIVPEGNNNYAQFNDPEFNKGVDEARAEPDNAKRAKLWGALNKQAIEKAAVAPLYFRKANYLIGSKVKGAFFHAWYGDPDFATISVQ